MKRPDLSRKQLIWCCVVAVLVVAYLLWPAGSGTNRSLPPGVAPGGASDNLTLEVGVSRISAASYHGKVEGYGEALPRFQLGLKAEVSGKVVGLEDAFATGRTVARGQLLATVDATDYERDLATARADLAATELSLTEEKRLASQARAEWERSGLEGDPDPLVLRLPQLQAAEASLDQARKRVKSAQRDLDNTRIVSPLDALVVSRDVQPGSYLQSGSEVAMLYGSEQVEISVPLSADQWIILGDGSGAGISGLEATLTSQENDWTWSGRVDREEQHVNLETRQRSLVIVVDKPLAQQQPLFPGSFVGVSIVGALFDNLWQVPETSITQNGELWFVDDRGLLQRYKPQIVFRADGYAHVRPFAAMREISIVLRPLSSYLAGMKVKPVEEDLS